ncbi:hypothetical protein BDP27DRAFT_1424416 [Rhodocollybia butyracea]|uniref:No apical meristem-associated C-terminal domain-containing protein n=1 Tax=Rhodocollybia butyracea TaxID=206335 RepID=A0A9P5PPS7_9AGAR|nr:hypothetical protein BDP27DRAFT_1424416 [Rhodocollybia butyracea]
MEKDTPLKDNKTLSLPQQQQQQNDGAGQPALSPPSIPAQLSNQLMPNQQTDPVQALLDAAKTLEDQDERLSKSPQRQPLTETQQPTQTVGKRSASPSPSPNATKPKKPKKEIKKEPGKGHWSDTEAAMLFKFILGPDRDSKWETLQVHPKRVFKDAAAEVKTRDLAACESFYGRSVKLYRAIHAIHKITGGGGDADKDEKEGFKWKMARAKDLGEEIGSLTFEKMKKWMDKGWYQLFADRLNSNPKTERMLNISSASDISPLKPEAFRAGNVSCSESMLDLTTMDDLDDNNIVLPKLEKVAAPKTPANKVNTPTAKPASTSRASRARDQFQETTTSITSYLNNKVGLDEKKHQLEERRLKLLEEKEQVNCARELLTDPFITDEMRTELQSFIFSTIVKKN